MDTVYSLEVWVPDGERWRWSAIGAYPTLDMAVESDGGKQEAGNYDKTGGIGLAPLIAVAGASSVACLTLAHRLGKGDDGEISDV